MNPGYAALRRWWSRPTAPLLLVAAAQLSIHLALNGAYGFHTDELYYILCGRHPAWGYVDFPPVTPILALLDTSLFGVHPWTLRLLPAVTGAAIVLLTGWCALEMGGSRWAAILASVVALLAPVLLATWLFQTVAFDQLAWVVAIYLLLRIARTGDRRLFVLLGLDVGIGLETKLTFAGLCAGLAVAMLTSRELRRAWRTRYPWIGLALAVGLAVPHAAWQVANDFPTLIYVRNHAADVLAGGGLTTFLAIFGVSLGPLLLPLWVAGLLFLFRDPRLRPVAVLTLVAILLFLPNGKGYYPAPTIPPVLAAGCVAAGRVGSRKRRRVVAGLVVGAGVVEVAVLVTIILPVVPPASLHRLGVDRVNADYANTVGWPEMTAQVAAVYNGLPPERRRSTAVLTNIDGTAGAIDIYGRGYGLPEAISPHLSFWYWKPTTVGATTLVSVGYSPSELNFLCGSITRAGTVRVPYGVTGLLQGAPILVCSDLREPVDAAWPALRNFS